MELGARESGRALGLVGFCATTPFEREERSFGGAAASRNPTREEEHLLEKTTGPLASLTGGSGYDQASVYREALGRNAPIPAVFGA